MGSHLCDALIARGDRVTCVDDLSTGRRVNLQHLMGHDRFEFVEHDVVSGGLVDLVQEPVGVVMHLASPASPPEYLRRPIDTLDVGSIGTRNLLELARHNAAKFFLASTSEVYGDPLVHPQPEDYWGNVNPIGRRSVYDEAKRFSEALATAYQREHDLDVRIVRVFNTYGPRMRPDDGRVVTNFVGQALAGEPLTLHGEGRQTRSFCFVDDQISGFLALLESDIDSPVNIGNPQEITMLELAELVVALTGSSSPIVRTSPYPDDPKVRRPDITRATEQLGWVPTVSLRDGLRTTIDWMRSVEITFDGS